MSDRCATSSSDGEQRESYLAAMLGGRVGYGRQPAVLVVDMQKGFTDPSHPLATDDDRLILLVGQVLAVARTNAVPVYFTTIAYSQAGLECRWFDKMPLLATLVTGSVWTEIDDRLCRRDDEPVITKRQASAVFGTDLVERLRAEEVDTVVVVGVTTSGCIRATVVDLLSSGFRVIVPAEAVGDRLAEPHRAALFDIDAKYGDVVKVDEAIAYLSRQKAPRRAELAASNRAQRPTEEMA